MPPCAVPSSRGQCGTAGQCADEPPSGDFALKAAQYASAHCLDSLPTSGSLSAHGFRYLELEDKDFKLTRGLGVGASPSP